VRFEVLINGKRICTAGVNGYGVLSAVLSRVKRNPTQVTPTALENTTLERFLAELVEFEVGGLDSSDAAGEHGQYLTWHKRPMQVGDEVTIRILPAGESDPPRTHVEPDT
jgi:hypothetical protein